MSERVFAYGSNMCSGRFRDYGVSPEGKGVPALLRDHRLLFNKRSDDGSGKANVEAAAGVDVWGVLYTIPNADLGVLESEEVGYVKRNEPVTVDDTVIEAWVLVASHPRAEPRQPYGWYKRFLVDGAREHGLPASYIDSLDTIQATDDSDRERDQKKRALKCAEGT
jgi:hypothetical protein